MMWKHEPGQRIVAESFPPMTRPDSPVRDTARSGCRRFPSSDPRLLRAVRCGAWRRFLLPNFLPCTLPVEPHGPLAPPGKWPALFHGLALALALTLALTLS